MTPEEFNEEIAGASERLLDLMVQAKFATYMADRVPPVLDAIRADGSRCRSSLSLGIPSTRSSTCSAGS